MGCKVCVLRDTIFSIYRIKRGSAMARKKKEPVMVDGKRKGPGRPGMLGGTPMMGVRLSPQQRAIALQIARNAGKAPAVSTGIHILLDQYAASLAAKS